ncbi:MAG: acyl carrier protein [Candidatus Woesearchaeota archaeon]|jgi:acyl carrier protein|nr:acyl carrier protein [Candidatus Woesearchaeota archaeon]MDP7610610.1 acyl carrier protein [Candidatus Woesearchaeota archaeon]|tara:strand:- start:122 stop:400 length:279 start_codon:yes stop_codon:yes gene_type:complete
MNDENKQEEMSSEESPLYEIVRKVISEMKDIEQEEISPDSNLVTDLGIDSLDIYGIIYYIEEESGISIPDDNIFSFETVDELIGYIGRNHNR